jgi:SAM-dependent methyltransferase
MPEEINRRAWDAMVRAAQPFTRPASDEQLAAPLATLDLAGWLPKSVAGMRVLCLAAAGGRQSVLFAAAGAEVTVVDLSPAMLALDREVASQRGLRVRTIEASMEDLSVLPDGHFHIVYQPVSTCYVPALKPVYQQVARVIVAGGIYLSQHKQPVSLQASTEPNLAGLYEIVEPYYRRGPLRTVRGTILREEGTVEYLHRWEELIGGLCRAGFVIEDLLEPAHGNPTAGAGTFGHRGLYIAPYVRIKARRKRSNKVDSQPLWTPR